MCIITLAVSFFFFGYLLPLFFLFHSLYLVSVVFWTGHSFASVLEHIDVVQDDVDIPHPPGHFDLLGEYPVFGSQDDDSQGNDNDTHSDYDISLVDDSVLSTESETTTCDIPVIVNIDSDNDDRKYLAILSATRLVSAKPVSDLAGKVPHIDLDSSVVDKLSPEVPTNSDASMDSCLNRQITAPDSPSTLHSKDSDDDLDLTPEEEEILESVLCIQPPYILPGFARLPEDPHGLDHVPRFSRHNVDATVVFLFRKSTRPGPASLVNAQRISMTVTKKANTVLKEISVAWNKAKDEVKSNDRSSVIGTLFSSKLFNKQEVDSEIVLPQRDAYDSWPWIRDGLEQDLSE